jgi:hypothetical protein
VAERAFGDDLALAEQGQVVRHQANGLWGIARVRAAAGAVSQAAELHQRALAMRHRIGDRLGVVDSFVGLATVVAPAEPEGAARLLGAAIALRAQTGAVPTQRETGEVDAALAAIGDAPDPGLLERARGAGADLDEDAAVAVAAGLAVARDGMSD